MKKETPAEKFERRRKKLLETFDFDSTIKMMLAVNYGWVAYMKPPVFSELKDKAVFFVNSLFDASIAACLEQNKTQTTITAGYAVTATPNGDLRLAFKPISEVCDDLDDSDAGYDSGDEDAEDIKITKD